MKEIREDCANLSPKPNTNCESKVQLVFDQTLQGLDILHGVELLKTILDVDVTSAFDFEGSLGSVAKAIVDRDSSLQFLFQYVDADPIAFTALYATFNCLKQ